MISKQKDSCRSNKIRIDFRHERKDKLAIFNSLLNTRFSNDLKLEVRTPTHHVIIFSISSRLNVSTINQFEFISIYLNMYKWGGKGGWILLWFLSWTHFVIPKRWAPIVHETMMKLNNEWKLLHSVIKWKFFSWFYSKYWKSFKKWFHRIRNWHVQRICT